MSKKIQNIAHKILLFILFLLPFHAFLSVILNYGLHLRSTFGGTLIISSWKEILLLITGFLFILQFFFSYFEKKEHQQKKLNLDFIDIFILIYVGFGILHFFLVKTGVFDLFFDTQLAAFTSWMQLIFGAKYDFIFLIAYFIVKHFRFSGTQITQMISAVLFSGTLSIFFGFILHFIVRPENFTFLGFRNDWSTSLPFESLAFCQKIEHSEICRMSGTFAGPNQFGAFLVVFLPLLFLFCIMLFRKEKSFFKKNQLPQFFQKYRYFFLFSAFLGLIALALTFSRSAWIGAFIAILTFLSFRFRLYLYWKKIVFFSILAFLFLGLLAIFSPLKDFLLRPDSTQGHFLAWKLGIDTMFSYPFGKGLGSSGPASSYIGKPIIPENWYLQVGIETGWIGLMIFITLLGFFIFQQYQTTRNVFSNGKLFESPITLAQITLFLSFLGVLVMACFLHTFEDAPTSLILFMLLGGLQSFSKYDFKNS